MGKKANYKNKIGTAMYVIGYFFVSVLLFIVMFNLGYANGGGIVFEKLSDKSFKLDDEEKQVDNVVNYEKMKSIKIDDDIINDTEIQLENINNPQENIQENSVNYTTSIIDLERMETEDVEVLEPEGKENIEDNNIQILLNGEKDVSDLNLFGSFEDDLKINEVEINLNSTNSQLANWTFGEILVNRPNSLNDSDGPSKIVVMDRNLGSPGAGISSDYYGYYYQWGNNYGFTFNSPYTNQKAVWNSMYTGGYYGESFIYGTTDYWQNSAHYNNLWGGGSDAENNNWGLDTIFETQESRRGPCPEGWHVPSAGEWGLLVKYWAMNNNYDYGPKQGMNDNLYQLKGGYSDFRNYFKIPFGGGIYYENHSSASQGLEGRFWSSSTVYFGNEGYSRGMSVQSAEARSSYYDYHRANGRSLRCFKNYGETYYTVTYNTDEGEYISSESVLSGDVVKYAPSPEKFGYNFTGWNISGTDIIFNLNTPVTGNLILKAVYEKKKFVVTRKYESGDIIDTTEVLYGDRPEHPDLDDIVEDKYTYVFIGWNPDIDTMITGNMDFIAVFEPIINKYDITRVDEDGTVLQLSGVEYGKIPVYSGSIPTKEKTEQYSYSFTGRGEPIVIVTGPKVYTAHYEAILNRYVITWKDGDENIITTGEVNWGETPDYTGSIPTKSPTLYYNYIFNGDWLPKIKAVTGNIEYIAQFNEESKSNYSGAGRKKSINNYKEIHGVTNEDSEIRLPSNSEAGQVIAIDGGIQKTVAVRNTEIVATVRNTTYSSSSRFTKEENDAYSFAKSNGLTITSSIEEEKMDTELTRIQMAKILSNFAINVLGQKPDISKGTIKFEDVTNKMNKQYDNAVTKAYQLGIMGQGMKNNKFRPDDGVTRAEFVSSLSRLLYQTEEGEYKGTSKYYIPHIAKLYNEGIINKTDPKIKEKRGYVMTMLMRTVQ